MIDHPKQPPHDGGAGSGSVSYPRQMWEDRYSKPGYYYGTEPNDFLVAALRTHVTPKGKALCLAEGEGRNAVYLATLGFHPLAVDQSPTGLAKAVQLAGTKGVSLETLCVDLNELELPAGVYTLATCIFGHVPPELRRKVHRGVVAALRPGGLYILEAYHPDNIGRWAGGPQEALVCMAAAALREELQGLECLHLEEVEREVNEGDVHRGYAAVTQVVARKS